MRKPNNERLKFELHIEPILNVIRNVMVAVIVLIGSVSVLYTMFSISTTWSIFAIIACIVIELFTIKS